MGSPLCEKTYTTEIITFTQLRLRAVIITNNIEVCEEPMVPTNPSLTKFEADKEN